MLGEDRALLDALCAASAAGTDLEDAARRISGWRTGVKRLRLKGLVAWESLAPSPSAEAAFAERGGGGSDAAEPPSLPRLGNNGRWPRWTPAEDDRLRAAYAAGEALEDVAAELGRPLNGVRSRAGEIGIAGTHAAGRGRGGFISAVDWSEAEDQLLRDLYGSRSAKEVAKAVGRSQRAVYSRAFVLGLKDPRARAWTDDEWRAVRIADARGLSLADVALALGRKYYAVAKRLEQSGLHFGRRARLASPITLAEILALEDLAVPLPPLAGRPRPEKVRQPEPWSAERRASFLETLERTGRIDEARPRRTKGLIAPPVRPTPTPAPPPPPRPLSEQPGGVLTRAGSVFNNSWHGRDRIEPPRRYKSDAEIAAESLRYQEERRRHEAAAGATRDLDIESAKRELQRRGRVVHRASLLGGRADRWYVGRLGTEVTDAELIAEAERLLA